LGRSKGDVAIAGTVQSGDHLFWVV